MYKKWGNFFQKLTSLKLKSLHCKEVGQVNWDGLFDEGYVSYIGMEKVQPPSEQMKLSLTKDEYCSSTNWLFPTKMVEWKPYCTLQVSNSIILTNMLQAMLLYEVKLIAQLKVFGCLFSLTSDVQCFFVSNRNSMRI